MNKFPNQAEMRPEMRISGGVEKSYLHTMVAGALLPFWQACITGIMVGLVTFILCLYWRMRDPWMWGLTVALLTMTGSWIIAQRHWFSLTGMERLTGLDLNQDGKIGNVKPAKPVEHYTTIRMNSVSKNKSWSQIAVRLPGTPEQLSELAAGILSDPPIPFTVRAWCRDRHIFTDTEFGNLRNIFLVSTSPNGNKLLIPSSERSERSGFEFTDDGKELLRHIRDGETE